MRLELKNINKSFGKNKVLKNLKLEVLPGEIHALVGENGAGKSTLVKIITGIHSLDSGNIYINNKDIKFKSIRDSEAAGIAIVNQELNMFPEMTVLENLFIGREISRNGIVNQKAQRRLANKTLKKLNVALDLDKKVKELSIGIQQIIEIAKSLLIKAELIIMDEPTTALTKKETNSLFKVIRLLKQEGKSIIYISHRLNEIFELCQKITIIRDGEYIISEKIKNITFDSIIENMVGYELGGLFPPKPEVERGKKLLEVKNFNTKTNKFKEINFSVYEGEILGFAGLIGAGRTELMNALYGLDKKVRGEVLVKNNKIKITLPQQAKDAGIGYVTENRKEEGLFLDFTIKDNIMYNNFKNISRKGVVDEKKLINISNHYIQQTNLKFEELEQPANELSGGNQQKLVLAKWLAHQPKILILDEPTKGIDVNSKKQIYNLIFNLKKSKVGIIIISSDLVEILGVADRISVMHEGKIVKTLTNKNLTDENIIKYMMGGK